MRGRSCSPSLRCIDAERSIATSTRAGRTVVAVVRQAGPLSIATASTRAATRHSRAAIPAGPAGAGP